MGLTLPTLTIVVRSPVVIKRLSLLPARSKSGNIIECVGTLLKATIAYALLAIHYMYLLSTMRTSISGESPSQPNQPTNQNQQQIMVVVPCNHVQRPYMSRSQLDPGVDYSSLKLACLADPFLQIEVPYQFSFGEVHHHVYSHQKALLGAEQPKFPKLSMPRNWMQMQ